MKLLNILAQTAILTTKATVQVALTGTKLIHESALIADATLSYASNKARRKLDPDHVLNSTLRDFSFRETIYMAHDNDYATSKLIDGRLNYPDFMVQVIGTVIKE